MFEQLGLQPKNRRTRVDVGNSPKPEEKSGPKKTEVVGEGEDAEEVEAEGEELSDRDLQIIYKKSVVPWLLPAYFDSPRIQQSTERRHPPRNDGAARNVQNDVTKLPKTSAEVRCPLRITFVARLTLHAVGCLPSNMAQMKHAKVTRCIPCGTSTLLLLQLVLPCSHYNIGMLSQRT